MRTNTHRHKQNKQSNSCVNIHNEADYIDFYHTSWLCEPTAGASLTALAFRWVFRCCKIPRYWFTTINVNYRPPQTRWFLVVLQLTDVCRRVSPLSTAFHAAKLPHALLVSVFRSRLSHSSRIVIVFSSNNCHFNRQINSKRRTIYKFWIMHDLKSDESLTNSLNYLECGGCRWKVRELFCVNDLRKWHQTSACDIDFSSTIGRFCADLMAQNSVCCDCFSLQTDCGSQLPRFIGCLNR